MGQHIAQLGPRKLALGKLVVVEQLELGKLVAAVELVELDKLAVEPIAGLVVLDKLVAVVALVVDRQLVVALELKQLGVVALELEQLGVVAQLVAALVVLVELGRFVFEQLVYLE